MFNLNDAMVIAIILAAFAWGVARILFPPGEV